MICEYVGCLSDVAASDTETSSAVQASTTATSKEAIDAEIALEQQGCVKLRINYFYWWIWFDYSELLFSALRFEIQIGLETAQR